MAACLRDAALFRGQIEQDGRPDIVPALAVGCSGGPDSMALTLLLRDWCASNSTSLTALIVDHGLRPEAGEEAARVAGWLKDRGVSAVVLQHRGPRPRSNIQAAARRMRYDLMRDWCIEQTVPMLAVAHHLEDQAETFLLRLARGSGVDGLSCMAPAGDMPGDPFGAVTLIRPLLDIERAQAHAVLEQAAWPYVEDPSNHDIRHARVRMRNLAGALAAEGLDAQRLARTARSMRRARTALERATAGFLAQHGTVDPYGFVRLDAQRFKGLDEETALRSLSTSLRLVSGEEYPYRLERLENLAAALRCYPPPGPRTLGGCRVETRGGLILFCREASAIGPPVPVRRSLFWDRRFQLEVSGDLDGLTIGKLGPDGVRRARSLDTIETLIDTVPGPVRASLPGLWRDDALIAVGLPGDPVSAGQADAGGARIKTVEFTGLAAWRRLAARAALQ